MNPQKNEASAVDGLKFFGKVNASISHELKNILAIISETAGFLNDLTQLAKQGKKFDMSMLENSSNSIAEEIERGFHTIRQMNFFAHSVDEPHAQINPLESLTTAIELTRFLSYARPVHIIPLEESMVIETNPFRLLQMFYLVLCDLYKSEPKADISVKFEKTKNDTVRLRFTGLVENFNFSAFSNETEVMKNLLGITLYSSPAPPHQLEMVLPGTAPV